MMANASQAPGPAPRELLPKIPGIQKDAPNFLLDMTRQYGPVSCFKAGSLPVFIVSHPDGVKHILQDQHRRYSKDTIQYNALATITGRGLLTSDGPFWLRQRRLAQPAFARPRLMALDQIIVPAAKAMLSRWETAARAGAILDVDSEMMRVALEIVGKALFSIDLSSEAGQLTRAVLTALDHIVYRARNIIVPPGWVPTPRNLRFKAAVKVLDEAVYRMINERRAAGSQGGAGQDDLLGMLLSARDEETGERMSDDQVRDEVITMLIAGHETVASALTWSWYLLAGHPDVAEALHSEALTIPAEREVTTADLPALPLSGQIFSEALRLYPPAWVISRKAIEADEVMGYEIPAGSPVILSPYVIHRQEEFWTDPLCFQPERFAPGNEVRSRYAYIPFGAGPRLCIGSQFAAIEAQIILTMVARRFKLEMAPGAKVHMDALVTLRPAGGLPMRALPY